MTHPAPTGTITPATKVRIHVYVEAVNDEFLTTSASIELDLATLDEAEANRQWLGTRAEFVLVAAQVGLEP